MKISVIIPTYKPRKDYLEKCLDSLFGQTFSHDEFEIFIVLNGCNEPYLELIESTVSQYDGSIQVHIVQTDCPGQSNARNMAMDMSKAPYICFIDYDDWVSPSYLECLYDASQENSVVQAFVTSFNETDNSYMSDYIGVYYDKFISYGKLSKKQGIHFLSNTATKLIPSNLILNVRYIPISIGEDALFMATISNRIHNVVLAKKDAVYYRRVHNDSLIHSRYPFKKWLKNRCQLTYLYIKTYSSNVREYEAWLFFHRIAAVWRGFLRYFFCKR